MVVCWCKADLLIVPHYRPVLKKAHSQQRGEQVYHYNNPCSIIVCPCVSLPAPTCAKKAAPCGALRPGKNAFQEMPCVRRAACKKMAVLKKPGDIIRWQAGPV